MVFLFFCHDVVPIVEVQVGFFLITGEIEFTEIFLKLTELMSERGVLFIELNQGIPTLDNLLIFVHVILLDEVGNSFQRENQ